MRFDFAISFAGPERELARRLAQDLRSDGFSVFFDEQFEHEMLGRDGADYLNDVFFRQSRFCIALVSRHYEKSAWSELERRAAQARELSEGPGFLIPVLVDDARPSWLLPTRIYFDLTRRTVAELRQILAKKLLSHTGGPYHTVWELEDLYDETEPIAVAGGFTDYEFLAWCTWAKDAPRPLKRLHRPGAGRDWTVETLPISERGRWIFGGEDIFIVVPEMSDEAIRFYNRQGEKVGTWRSPRRYKWNSLTDCKYNGAALLLGYCGGDVWYLDIRTMQARELRRGGEEVQYVNVDFWGESEVVVAPDVRGIEVYAVGDSREIEARDTPESAMAVWCFPETDGVVVGGYTRIFHFQRSDWDVRHECQLQTLGIYAECRAWKAPLYAFISGSPLGYNSIEIHDARTANILLQNKSIGLDHRGPKHWDSIAISPFGLAVAATQGKNLLIWERKMLPEH